MGSINKSSGLSFRDLHSSWNHPGSFKLVFFVSLAFLLLNLILKGIFLDHVQIGMDEPFTIFHAQMTPGEIVSELAEHNNPPLFELLLHYWIKIFGISPFAVRFPSLLFSSLTAVFIFLTGRKIAGMGPGILAALIFSLSSEQIYFSHEARVYALFAMLSIASLYFFMRWIDPGKSTIARLVPVLICNALIIYAHYFGFFILAVEFGCLILLRHEQKLKKILQFGASLLVCALLYLPHVATVLDRFSKASGEHWVPQPSLQGLYTTLANYSNQPVPTVIALAILLAGLSIFVYKLARKKTKFRTDVLLLVAVFPLCFLFLFGIGYIIPVFLGRYTVFSIMAYYVLLALSIDYVFKSRSRYLVMAALLISFALSINLKPGKNSQWKEVAEDIRTHRHPAENVLITPEWNIRSFGYHYNLDYFRDYAHFTELMAGDHISGIKPKTKLEKTWLKKAQYLTLISVGEIKLKKFKFLGAYIGKNFTVLRTKEDLHGIKIVRYKRVQSP